MAINPMDYKDNHHVALFIAGCERLFAKSDSYASLEKHLSEYVSTASMQDIAITIDFCVINFNSIDIDVIVCLIEATAKGDILDAVPQRKELFHLAWQYVFR